MALPTRRCPMTAPMTIATTQTPRTTTQTIRAPYYRGGRPSLARRLGGSTRQASEQRKASDMVFEVPASKSSVKKNRFEFKIGDKKYDVPLIRYLPGHVVEMLAEAEQKGGI